MIFEKILFYIIAITLFVNIFLKIMKKKDIIYFISLILQTIGILISFIYLIINIEMNILLKAIIYIISIGIPVIILILEKKNINISEKIYLQIAKLFLLFKDTKKTKKILLSLIEKDENSKMAHKLLAEIYEKKRTELEERLMNMLK